MGVDRLSTALRMLITDCHMHLDGVLLACMHACIGSPRTHAPFSMHGVGGATYIVLL